MAFPKPEVLSPLVTLCGHAYLSTSCFHTQAVVSFPSIFCVRKQNKQNNSSVPLHALNSSRRDININCWSKLRHGFSCILYDYSQSLHAALSLFRLLRVCGWTTFTCPRHCKPTSLCIDRELFTEVQYQLVAQHFFIIKVFHMFRPHLLAKKSGRNMWQIIISKCCVTSWYWTFFLCNIVARKLYNIKVNMNYVYNCRF